MWFDGSKISSRVYCGRENGVMGSLEARRVAEGDWTSFWQAVIVDLFFGCTVRLFWQLRMGDTAFLGRPWLASPPGASLRLIRDCD